jgi:hypothetical protein
MSVREYECRRIRRHVLAETPAYLYPLSLISYFPALILSYSPRPPHTHTPTLPHPDYEFIVTRNSSLLRVPRILS